MNTSTQTAGSFLAALVTQDFDRLSETVAPDATMRTLLPRGHVDWVGREEVVGRFRFWFGGTDAFEVVDSAAATVGSRAHLWWRVRLRAERLGPQWHTIEQHAFADALDAGQIARLDLLCSGFLHETADARRPLVAGGAR